LVGVLSDPRAYGKCEAYTDHTRHSVDLAIGLDEDGLDEDVVDGRVGCVEPALTRSRRRRDREGARRR
jgi:hypothetical protein